MGVEGEANHLFSMPFESAHAIPVLSTPNFAGFVERSGGDEVSEGVIERQAKDDVLVARHRQDLLAGLSVPQLGRSVVAACDEPARHPVLTCRRLC